MTLLELGAVATLTALAGYLLELRWWTVVLLVIATVCIVNAVRVWHEDRGDD